MKKYDTNELKKLERAVIGHSLAYAHYLDYLGPRDKDNEFLRELFKATDNLSKFYKRYKIVNNKPQKISK